MLNLQIKKFDANIFSLRKYSNVHVHIANTYKYHIILFEKDCECQVNFNLCEVKRRQVLFLNTTDVFICNTQENKLLELSFNNDVFDKDHCETQRLVNGLLFDDLLNCNFLNVETRDYVKLKANLKYLLSFQAKEETKNMELIFKEIISQAIIIKHNQLFSENEISKDHHVVYKYLSLVNEHFKMEHNVFVYAEILRVQPKILTKIFSDLKIQNPKSYLNKRILLAAKKILAYSSNKSTEVSYEIGFNEPAYFARFFKKNTGITPKQFRKSLNISKSNN